MVPEAQHPVALILQETSAFHLLKQKRIVLTAVDFDNQTRLMANKIDGGGPKRHLPTKLVAVDLPRSQYLPKAVLRYGHSTSQRSSAVACSLDWMFLHLRAEVRRPSPPPQPSPI